jgi:uncharacterized protein involved in tolerance to divalent cations
MAEYIEVSTTVEGREKATELAHGILRANLGASIQICQVATLTRWDIGIEDTAGWRLAITTTPTLYPQLEKHIRESHDDDDPPIVITSIMGGGNSYLDWLRRELDPS